jgi:hypothetical protein
MTPSFSRHSPSKGRRVAGGGVGFLIPGLKAGAIHQGFPANLTRNVCATKKDCSRIFLKNFLLKLHFLLTVRGVVHNLILNLHKNL